MRDTRDAPAKPRHRVREPMTSTPQSPRRAVATATIVGRGRLGRVMARALRGAGIGVNGPIGRGEFVEPADVVLLCVPDGEIAAAATSLRGGSGLVGHVSGATPLAGLDVDFGLHPLQTFVGDEGPDAFHGIGCAIAGRSPDALAVAQELATRLGAARSRSRTNSGPATTPPHRSRRTSS